MNNLLTNIKSTMDAIMQAPGRFVALLLLIIAAFAIARFAEGRARRREIAENGRAEDMFSTRKIAIIGVFSAIAFVLMLFEFPLFFAPGFYKFDFSDIPALIGGFAAGPMVGVMIEFIKVTLNVIIQGPTPGFVGEIANFVVGAAFIIPATVIYRFKKTRKVALISCIAGTACITIVGASLNAFFLLPAYALAYGVDVDYFIAAGTAINPAVKNLFTFCALCVAPFNLLKGTVDSVLTFLVYKQLSPILKMSNVASRKNVAEAKAEEG
jgi:riboflavin transporter FmnP